MSAPRIINGTPGTRWVNDTGKIRYQLVVNWVNSCGRCCQRDHAISTSKWPIPFHRLCRCRIIIIYPGKESLPFVDFRAEIDKLPAYRRQHVIGKAALALVDNHVLRWPDIVLRDRIRPLNELVAKHKLTVERMVAGGVDRRTAERAFAQALGHDAETLAEAHRKALAAEVAAKAEQQRQAREATKARLAAAEAQLAARPRRLPGPTAAERAAGASAAHLVHVQATTTTRLRQAGVKLATAHEAGLQARAEAELGVKFVADAASASRSYRTVVVDVGKVDADLARLKGFYVTPGGGGASIAGRYEEFGRFVAKAKAQEIAVEMPRMGIGAGTGHAEIENGRHRFAWLRDHGATSVPVRVPKEEEVEFRQRYGYVPPTAEAKAVAARGPKAYAPPKAPLEPSPVMGRAFTEARPGAPVTDRQRAEMAAYAREHYGAWAAGLTRDESAALEDYVQRGYLQINRALRTEGVTPEVRDRVAHLDAALGRARTPEDLIAFRGVRDFKALTGVDIKKAEKLVGAVVRDDGFMSTSLDRETATRFQSSTQGTYFVVRVPAGTNAAAVGAAQDRQEAELLIARGHGLRITQVVHGEVKGLRHTYIHAELVPPGEAAAAVKPEPAAKPEPKPKPKTKPEPGPKPELKPKVAAAPVPKQKPAPVPYTQVPAAVAKVRARLDAYTEGDRKVAQIVEFTAAHAAHAEAVRGHEATVADLQAQLQGAKGKAAKEALHEKLADAEERLTAALAERKKAGAKARHNLLSVLATDDPMALDHGGTLEGLTGTAQAGAEAALGFWGKILGKGKPDIFAGDVAKQGAPQRIKDKVEFAFHQIPKDEEQRAYHQAGAIHLAEHFSGAETSIHELGHLLEYHVPGWGNAAQAFLRHRVGDEPLTQMKSLKLPGTSFGADEWGRKDRFDEAFGDDGWYVGKDYGPGSSEITAMGIQKLFEDPGGFVRKDPEYAKFLIGLLSGHLR